MGKKIILPLRVTVELPDEIRDGMELGTIVAPGPILTPPPAPTPQPGPGPVAGTVSVEELTRQLPRREENRDSRGSSLKSSLTIHWLGPSGPGDPSDDGVRQLLFRIAFDHIAKDWGGGQGGQGIMYHEAIAPSGRVFVTRDYTEILWHADNAEANATSRAILVVCSQAVNATAEQISVLRRRYADFQKPPTYPHSRWTATACPGDLLRSVIGALR